ncbi:MAG: lactate utilization protein [Desulfuromonas sp.]|nr:MAG: lactate utilization protein [Desulfuromonas sp.]
MPNKKNIERFSTAANAVGAVVASLTDAAEAATYISEHVAGAIILPPSSSLERLGLANELAKHDSELIQDEFRTKAAQASAGVTGANFAIAETGSVVLESTPEATRLASTLPEKHFVLLDPSKIIDDGDDAVPLLRRFHQEQPRNFLAYLTGPSRTADIERVLTIGVHGPRELHILLLDGLSDDPLEN